MATHACAVVGVNFDASYEALQLDNGNEDVNEGGCNKGLD
jgi:hypothetical protein